MRLPSSRTRYLLPFPELTLNSTRFRASRQPLNLFLLLHPPKANPVRMPFEGERKRTHRSYSLNRPVRITSIFSERFIDQDQLASEGDILRVFTCPETASKEYGLPLRKRSTPPALPRVSWTNCSNSALTLSPGLR